MMTANARNTNPMTEIEAGSLGMPAYTNAAVATAVDDVTPKPIVWDSSLFRGAMSLVIDDAPAPTPTTVPEPPKVPGFMDPSIFAQAIREARSA